MSESSPENLMRVSCTLNGRPVELEFAPTERLLDTLRYRLGLTGTKEGCGEGECGACTVYIDALPVNSCLVPTYQARGRNIETIEAHRPDDLGPMHQFGATQCGACTPGVVMTARWVRAHPELLKTHTLRDLMAGNLCRCTGYDGIIDGLEKTMEPSADRDAGSEGA